MTNTSFQQVWDNPYPNLDQITSKNPTGKEQQFRIYQEVLEVLRPSLSALYLNPLAQNSIPITVTAIPAGAGSGKTRTLLSIMIALIRLGESPNQIHSLSFTNVSANDLRGKIITGSVNFLQSDLHADDTKFQASNINCGTIHKHAIDMLRQLEPHVGGVGYYFEDANQSTPVVSENPYEEEEVKTTRKSMLLSLFTSIYFHQQNNPYGRQLADSLANFINQDAKVSYNRFIVNGLQNLDLLTESDKFINEESLSDAGLGAFTNIDNTDPNYAIAVATDALLRLANAKDVFNQEDKYELLGLPKYLMVDEAQDIDMIQAFYLRALALNGTHIVLVGDPRQTLYEFRHALSEWVFEQKFLSALFVDTNVQTRITQQALTTNYRSRQEILQFAEMMSERMVTYAQYERPEEAKYIDIIDDPKESVRPNECFIPQDTALAGDKKQPAVSVIIGDISDHDDWLISKSPTEKSVTNKPTTTLPKAIGLQRLQKRLSKAQHTETEETETQLKLECKKYQLPSKCGGKNQQQIQQLFGVLYDRCQQGDSVGILLRNNATPEDKNFLKNIINTEKQISFDSSSVSIGQTGNERNAPLDNYYFLDTNNQLSYGVPFTTLMTAAAIHYFFSWDKEVKVKFQLQGDLKEINWIRPAQTLEGAKKNNDLDFKSIELELTPFFEALVIHRKKLLPNTAIARLEEQQSALLSIFAKFIESVLLNYAVLLWSAKEGEQYLQHPCRFQGCVTFFHKESNAFIIRKLSTTKRYFKLMWEAISKTTFELTQEQRTLLKSLNLTNEWLVSGINLVNYPQSLAELRDELTYLSQDDETFNKCLKQRERVHEQFSKFYHRKTRTYLRAIAKKVGHEVRYNMSDNVSETVILRTAHDHYMEARNEARTNTWFKGEGESRKSYGLFNDMLEGIRDIDIQAKPKSNRNLTDDNETQTHEIVFSTIHSSKGLEWDHVVLVLPKATGNDTSTSFKSARDLLYVAMTRAKQTLTILIEKEKNQRVSANDTCFKVANRLIHDCTKQLGWYNRTLAFTSNSGSQEDKTKHLQPIVCIETTHSELEKASTCQIHHYIQHNRLLSSMNPLATPSYAFFFHSTLSSLCAAMVGQRIIIPDDPIVEMAEYVKEIAQTPKDFQQLTDELVRNLQEPCNSVMQTMIPMYYLVGESRFLALVDYYAVNFLQQLASIILGSQLFSNLLIASRLPNHRILIEKSMRELEKVENDSVYLPLYGVPDITIIGDTINYIADYKTMVSQKNDELPVNEAVVQQISQKTAQQITLYQGMLRKSHPQIDNLCSEVIYVADLTVPEYEDIPIVSPHLPPFIDDGLFNVQTYPSAIVLFSQVFDSKQYQKTVKDVDTVRLQTENYDNFIPSNLFEPIPIPNLLIKGEVTFESCLGCASRVHCQQAKSPA